jgi:hypothetical protein
MLTCCSGEISANYLNSDILGTGINTSTLQPIAQHLMDTPSPSIVLTLDVSASMEYQVRISIWYAPCHTFSMCLVSGNG